MAVDPDSIPRYPQPVDRAPSRTCGNCAFCKLPPGCAVCVRDVVLPSDVDDGELVVVGVDDEGCAHWRISKWA